VIQSYGFATAKDSSSILLEKNKTILREIHILFVKNY